MTNIQVEDFDFEISSEDLEGVIKLVNDSKENALNAMRLYFDLLDIDTDALGELEKSLTKIMQPYNNIWFARHDSENNETWIHIIPLLSLFKDSNKSYEEIILELTHILIHEYIHSFRDFIIKFENDDYKYYEKIYSEYYDKYYYLIEDNDDVQLLNVIEKGNNYKTKEYTLVFYYDGKFIETSIKKHNLKGKSISEYIEKCKFRIKNKKESFYSLCLKETNDIFLASKIRDNNYTPLVGAEECLTDSFSKIILNNMYSDYTLNIEEKHPVKRYYSIGFDIISRMSPEDIKWFFTSYMNDTFDNTLTSVFKEDYDEIMSLLLDIYINLRNTLKIDEDKYQECIRLIRK